jgi:hypothetical protein
MPALASYYTLFSFPFASLYKPMPLTMQISIHHARFFGLRLSLLSTPHAHTSPPVHHLSHYHQTVRNKPSCLPPPLQTSIPTTTHLAPALPTTPTRLVCPVGELDTIRVHVLFAVAVVLEDSPDRDAGQSEAWC